MKRYETLKFVIDWGYTVIILIISLGIVLTVYFYGNQEAKARSNSIVVKRSHN